MTDFPGKIDDLIYFPAETATIGIESTKRITSYSEYGLPLGIDGIDGYFAPVMPGQLSVLIGQTSHYKSGMMSFLSENAAKHIKNTKNRGNPPAIVYISTEDFIEEQAYIMFARHGIETVSGLAAGQIVDMKKLEQSAISVAGIPIYRIGLSFSRPSIMYEQLYLSNMIRAIDKIAEVRDVRGIFVDYLQALPIDPEVKKAEISGQRRLQVRQDVYRLKQAAAFFKTPVWVAVQAKQEMSTSGNQIKIPNVYDGEESSSIAQRADRVLSVWLPKMHYLPGSQIRLGTTSVTVQENTMLIKVAKQRGSFPSGRVWICEIDYEHGKVSVKDNATEEVPF